MGGRRIILSAHAWKQMSRRGIPDQVVARIVSHPGQVLSLRRGREVRQDLVMLPPTRKRYLIRVIVDIAGHDIEIVTVYRTSKVAKYWRAP